MAFAAFSAAMAVGRFGGDRLRRRWGAASLVRGSALLAAAGLAFAVLVATPIAAIVGFACAGLGLSNAVPVMFGAAGRLPGMQPGAGIAATASIGYLGFLVGPPLIGFAAQATSLGTALGLLVVACGLVATFASLVRIADDEPATSGSEAERRPPDREPARSGRRHRPRLAVLVDGDAGELGLGDLDLLAGPAALGPGLDRAG